jgi:hypothetical protein
MRVHGVLRPTSRLVLSLYPSAWRVRYGAELEDVLDQHQVTVSTVLNLGVSALDAHRHPELGPADALPASAHLRSGLGSMLLASVAFALAWAAVLSVRWRSSDGYGADFPAVRLAIRLVQAAGAVGLLAIMAGAFLFLASARLHQGQPRRGLLAPLAVALLACAAFVGLVRAAGIGSYIEPGPSGVLLLMALFGWAVGAACFARLVRHAAPDPTVPRLCVMLGRVGVVAMAFAVAASVWLGVAVSLEAPAMGAELLPIIPMAVAAAWAAAALRGSRSKSPNRLHVE